jgi:hypothetical protein
MRMPADSTCRNQLAVEADKIERLGKPLDEYDTRLGVARRYEYMDRVIIVEYRDGRPIALEVERRPLRQND